MNLSIKRNVIVLTVLLAAVAPLCGCKGKKRGGGTSSAKESKEASQALDVVGKLGQDIVGKLGQESKANECISNLKQIQTAKEQLLMNCKELTEANLYGPTGLIRVKPTCPADNSEYWIGDAETDPVCTSRFANDRKFPHRLPSYEE